MSRSDRLLALIEATHGQPCVWGSEGSDCSSWPARWFEAERGTRLALPEYRSEVEARALIEAAGGLEVLWRDALTAAGAHEIAFPEIGDVGVFRTSKGASGCIFGADGIAFVRSEAGVWMIRPRQKTILAAFAT